MTLNYLSFRAEGEKTNDFNAKQRKNFKFKFHFPSSGETQFLAYICTKSQKFMFVGFVGKHKLCFRWKKVHWQFVFPSPSFVGRKKIYLEKVCAVSNERRKMCNNKKPFAPSPFSKRRNEDLSTCPARRLQQKPPEITITLQLAALEKPFQVSPRP
jgi:hypothetical protein